MFKNHDIEGNKNAINLLLLNKIYNKNIKFIKIDIKSIENLYFNKFQINGPIIYDIIPKIAPIDNAKETNLSS